MLIKWSITLKLKWICNNKDRKQVFFWMHFVLIRLQFNEWMQNVNFYNAIALQIVGSYLNCSYTYCNLCQDF